MWYLVAALCGFGAALHYMSEQHYVMAVIMWLCSGFLFFTALTS